jgi:hypothetical protein
MAFAFTTIAETVLGNKRVNYGQFTQGNTDTGGAITTGFSVVDYFEASYATDASDSSGVITITTADPGGAQTGYWMAIGG